MKKSVMLTAVMAGLCAGALFGGEAEAELARHMGRYKLVSGSAKCLPNLELTSRQRNGTGGVAEEWFVMSTFDDAGFAYAMDVQERMADVPARRIAPGEYLFNGKSGGNGTERIELSFNGDRVRVEQSTVHVLPVRVACEYSR